MSTELKGTLELANIGTQFQFSSSIPGAAAGAPARTVYEDLHDNCLGTATPLQSGFFPVEAGGHQALQPLAVLEGGPLADGVHGRHR
jgi:hypothetical protein